MENQRSGWAFVGSVDRSSLVKNTRNIPHREFPNHPNILVLKPPGRRIGQTKDHQDQPVLDLNSGSPSGYLAAMAKPLSLLKEICAAPGRDEPLVFKDDFSSRSQGGEVFRSVEDVPILREEPPDLKRISPSHVSSGISSEALERICSVPDYTLMLGGGNTTFSHPKVLDVEFNLYSNTDVVADAHRLPFKNDTFDLFFAMNVFEHLSQPAVVADEVMRVLKPGGSLHIHTAFLQPLHEEPIHFFNATEFGVREWLKKFQDIKCEVSPNFNPLYSIAWLAAEIQRQVKVELGRDRAAEIGSLTLEEVAHFWTHPEGWNQTATDTFFQLSESAQRPIAAGFDFKARKPEA